MTVQEAKELCISDVLFVSDEHEEIVIDALTELEQYRALGTVEEIIKHRDNLEQENHEYSCIGTVEEMKEAREKQVAKKPLADSHGERGMGFLIPICPNCRESVEEGEHHCECGQALKWGEEDD